ncbi:hypothetical protein [Leptospira interrogans]|uniref:hypothetical protein n=1 Tax=Leptospira interrogans TaxID=173 RepID=UPI0007748812|nr:hypothetical protein [Leptospira interrogans]
MRIRNRLNKLELFETAENVEKYLELLEKNRNVAQSIFERAEGKLSVQKVCNLLDWPEKHYREYLRKGRLRIDRLFLAINRLEKLIK